MIKNHFAFKPDFKNPVDVFPDLKTINPGRQTRTVLQDITTLSW